MQATTTRLSTAIFDDLSPGARATAWDARLREAGLLQDVPPEATADSPPGALRAIQDALGVLRIAEAALVEAQEADPTRNLPLPDVFWGAIMVALLGVILFANALVAWLGSFAIWGGIAFAGAVALFTVIDRRRRAAEVAAQERRDEAAAALFSAVESLVARNFVATLPEGPLVSTPDLDRLRVLEAALALSDPSSPIVSRIRADILSAEARLDALLAAPKQGWQTAGLAIDVDAYEREVDAL